MTPTTLKLAMCAVRTFGTIAVIGIVGMLVRYFAIDYDDVKAVLGIINAYAPELILLTLIGGVGFAFYRATIDPDSDFDFMHFFMAGKPEDIFKLGYFALLLVAVWSIFALIWRDRYTTEYALAVFGAFLLKAGLDTAGKAWGSNTREPTPPPAEGGK